MTHQQDLTGGQRVVLDELAGLPTRSLPPSSTPKSGSAGSALEVETLPRSLMEAQKKGSNMK